jgi:hypothetical protein
VTWLRDLATKAEIGIAGFMQERMHLSTDTNVDDSMKRVSVMLKHMNTKFKAQTIVLGLSDFNVAGSTFTDSREALIAFMSRLTSLNPPMTAVLVTMPDKAKDGSKRGIADDEGALEAEMYLKKLWCDRRRTL